MKPRHDKSTYKAMPAVKQIGRAIVESQYVVVVTGRDLLADVLRQRALERLHHRHGGQQC